MHTESNKYRLQHATRAVLAALPRKCGAHNFELAWRLAVTYLIIVLSFNVRVSCGLRMLHSYIMHHFS